MESIVEERLLERVKDELGSCLFKDQNDSQTLFSRFIRWASYFVASLATLWLGRWYVMKGGVSLDEGTVDAFALYAILTGGLLVFILMILLGVAIMIVPLVWIACYTGVVAVLFVVLEPVHLYRSFGSPFRREMLLVPIRVACALVLRMFLLPFEL